MKNVQRNYILGIVVLLSFAFFLITMYITDFKNGYSIGVTGVIGIVVVLTSIFQFATWGLDRKVQKDEMGKKVATISAKTSYHILTISLFVLWVADRIIFVRRNDFGNISLFAAICLSLVIFPIVQFFSARQYK
ncbi:MULTISPECIES: hypothetical protein [Priestia]|uniref:hypothetical protein n=1 Tax=Priestia TaxID=2800373 RepID=UPI000C9CD8A8|nr:MULTISPECIES: hypothetical protein [Priestia]MBX9993590.1 hypothetical protein [Priestia aryabhattai]PNE07276.1 hypothetical protein C1Y47_10985 [Priestia megaterium]